MHPGAGKTALRGMVLVAVFLSAGVGTIVTMYTLGIPVVLGAHVGDAGPGPLPGTHWVIVQLKALGWAEGALLVVGVFAVSFLLVFLLVLAGLGTVVRLSSKSPSFDAAMGTLSEALGKTSGDLASGFFVGGVVAGVLLHSWLAGG